MLSALPISIVLSTLMTLAANQPQEQHKHAQEQAKTQSTVVTGKLVDSTWFVPEEKGPTGDRVARAAAKLADGVPAAILAKGEENETSLSFLLINPAPLAPYAGKVAKVEGELVHDGKAIIPTRMYVGDAGTWRQIQLAAPKEPSKAEPRPGEHAQAHERQPSPSEAPAKTETEHAGHSPEPKGSAASEHEAHDHGSGAEHGLVVSPEKGDEHGDEHERPAILAVPPAHPLLVNFTAGLFPVAVIAEWLGKLLRRRSLTTAAWWMLFFAAVPTPLTAIAGWIWFQELGGMGHAQIQVHKWMGLFLAVTLPILAIWRARIYARNLDPGSNYLAVLTAVLLALVVQGHLGATMSFGSHGSEAVQGHSHG